MARGDRFIAGGFRATDVIDALDGVTPDLAFFTTYTFSPDAFEAQYLRPLQRLGCRRVVDLADPAGLAQSFEQAGDATGIGSDYYLRQVDGWSAYHAKIVLLQAPARTVLAVSSGNLTVSGLLANAEVGGLCALGEPEATAALSRLAFNGAFGRCSRAPSVPVGPVRDFVNRDLGTPSGTGRPSRSIRSGPI
jgi:hypothetical protein